MTTDYSELVSVKVSKGAHLFLRHVPTLGIQMSAFASQAIIDKFRRDFPEIFDYIMKRENDDLSEWFQSIIYGHLSPYDDDQLDRVGLDKPNGKKDR